MSYACLREKRPGSWELRVELRGRSHYRYTRGTREQAAAALAGFRAEMDQQGAAPALPSTPFAAWAATWMAERPELAAATVEKYRRHLTKYILPVLGTKRLSAIVVGDGTELQRPLLAAGHAATAGQVLRLASEMLEDAARKRVIPANPLKLARAARAPRPDHAVIQPRDFAALDRLMPGPAADLIRLALASGMRRNELLALRWRDVDLDAGRLDVGASLESQAGTSRRRKSTKTRAGTRPVALSADAVAILRRRRIEAAPGALAAGRDMMTLPVFPAADGLSWAAPTLVSRDCAAALRRVGLDSGLHGLRHAHATALLSEGASVNAVAARLGHANVTTTIGIYGHALPRDDARAADTIGRLMNAGRAP
jgi:integrase